MTGKCTLACVGGDRNQRSECEEFDMLAPTAVSRSAV
jgi:hypothetical protein